MIKQLTKQRRTVMEKDFAKVSEKALKIYQDLTIQRDTVQSATLAALLGKEIDACLRMMNAYNDYAELCQKRYIESIDRRTKDLNDAIANAKSIPDPVKQIQYLDHAKIVHEQRADRERIDEIAYERSTDIYLTVLSRDFKDWDAFAIKAGKAVVESAASLTPVISTGQFIVDCVRKFSELRKEFNDNGTDYSETDKQLLIIEIHTQMAEKTTEMLLQGINNNNNSNDVA